MDIGSVFNVLYFLKQIKMCKKLFRKLVLNKHRQISKLLKL